MLRIYNSLSGQKEFLIPIHPGEIRLYVCGNTVYDYCHIGHARSMLIFDMVVRYLRKRNFKVIYVRNITDIDDKIIQRAIENQETVTQLTERFITEMHNDESALQLLPPDYEPRATGYVSQIIELVERLISQKMAYVAKNNDVYFSVRSFKDYGKLSHRSLDELMAGARVDVNEDKRDPLDFVLWKSSKPDEPKWLSPWGEGRPGWHIECSAMSTTLLGQPFDIHGGGLDLKFPHHENEIAQSEAACNATFAKLWMHGGLLQVNHQKMSKSLGNFLTIQEVLAKHDAEVIRYFMLSSHYRSPVNYVEDHLLTLRSGLERLYLAIRGLPKVAPFNTEFSERFYAVMDDDFNTPEAFSVLFEMAHEINRYREQQEQDKAALLAAELCQLAEIFGILQHDPEAFLRGSVSSDDAERIEALIKERENARRDKDWARADEIRCQLTEMGVVLEDSGKDTTWRRM